MKKTILILAVLFAFYGANSQTVVKDKQGNYIAVKAIKDSTKTDAKPTGKTYTDTKGTVYPVMISKNGKLFVIRISKAGNRYNQYLKLN
jgi:hypothetical protein